MTAPGARAVVTVSWTCSRRPAPSSARRSRSSRRCAYPLTSAAMCTSSASASAATAHTSSTTSPERTTSRPPRSRRPASRSAQAIGEERQPVRGGEPGLGPPPGHARTAAPPGGPAWPAARSGGWSCSRRSEVNRTTETFMTCAPGTNRARVPGAVDQPPDAGARPVGASACAGRRPSRCCGPCRRTPRVEGRDAPPVEVAQQAVRVEQRPLAVAGAPAPPGVVRLGVHLQPGQTRQPHLRAQPQQTAGLDLLDPPEVQRVAHPQPCRVPAARGAARPRRRAGPASRAPPRRAGRSTSRCRRRSPR